MIRVIDVGDREVPDQPPPYAAMVASGDAEVFGFDYPNIIADGLPRQFNFTSSSPNNSLLVPNLPLLRNFQHLAGLFDVSHSRLVSTQRLDEIPRCRGAQWLKMDCQGSEAMVIEGAAETLKSVLVVQTEVSFIPFYLDQPLSGDIDVLLRRHGFMFHHGLGVANRPVVHDAESLDPEPDAIKQFLYGEMLYVRDLQHWGELNAEQLNAMALILERGYRSLGLARLARRMADRRKS